MRPPVGRGSGARYRRGGLMAQAQGVRSDSGAPASSAAGWRERLLRRLSLRARLVLLVVASFLPLLGFALVLQYLAYRDAYADAADQALALARSLVQTVDRELQARSAAL